MSELEVTLTGNATLFDTNVPAGTFSLSFDIDSASGTNVRDLPGDFIQSGMAITNVRESVNGLLLNVPTAQVGLLETSQFPIGANPTEVVLGTPNFAWRYFTDAPQGSHLGMFLLAQNGSASPGIGAIFPTWDIGVIAARVTEAPVSAPETGTPGSQPFSCGYLRGCSLPPHGRLEAANSVKFAPPRGRNMSRRTFRPVTATSSATVLAVASLLAVAVASAAEMEVDSQGVIIEYQDGKNVGTFHESAVTFFDTEAPPGGFVIQGGFAKSLAFGPGGNIVGYNFTVPGFSAFADFHDSPDPGLHSSTFSIGYDAGVSGLAFNPISQSTYLSNSDPWALFFNGASFEAQQSEFPVCYGGLCSSGGDPGLSPGTDYLINFSGTIREVPEPATLGLMGLALAGMIVARRRQRVLTGIWPRPRGPSS